MERLIAGGDGRLTQERLMGALSALDALQPLAMAELWAVPAGARNGPAGRFYAWRAPSSGAAGCAQGRALGRRGGRGRIAPALPSSNTP